MYMVSEGDRDSGSLELVIVCVRTSVWANKERCIYHKHGISRLLRVMVFELYISTGSSDIYSILDNR